MEQKALIIGEETVRKYLSAEDVIDICEKPTWLVTGGVSDGNFVSPFGVATLDGCGRCGGKLHTREEYLKTQSVQQRFVLMLALLQRLFA